MGFDVKVLIFPPISQTGFKSKLMGFLQLLKKNCSQLTLCVVQIWDLCFSPIWLLATLNGTWIVLNIWQSVRASAAYTAEITTTKVDKRVNYTAVTPSCISVGTPHATSKKQITIFPFLQEQGLFFPLGNGNTFMVVSSKIHTIPHSQKWSRKITETQNDLT